MSVDRYTRRMARRTSSATSPPVPGKTGGRPVSAAVSSMTRNAVSTDTTRHRAPLKMSDAPGRIGRSTGSVPSV